MDHDNVYLNAGIFKSEITCTFLNILSDKAEHVMDKILPRTFGKEEPKNELARRLFSISQNRKKLYRLANKIVEENFNINSLYQQVIYKYIDKMTDEIDNDNVKISTDIPTPDGFIVGFLGVFFSKNDICSGRYKNYDPSEKMITCQSIMRKTLNILIFNKIKIINIGNDEESDCENEYINDDDEFNKNHF